jgi:hypothetical protein
VAISFNKKGFVENLEKNQFSAVGRTVRALGADGPWAFEFYLICEVFGKVLREKITSGRTVRGLPAYGPRRPGGRSAGSWRKVRPV